MAVASRMAGARAARHVKAIVAVKNMTGAAGIGV